MKASAGRSIALSRNLSRLAGTYRKLRARGMGSPTLSCPAKAGHPVLTGRQRNGRQCDALSSLVTGSPAYAGDDVEGYSAAWVGTAWLDVEPIRVTPDDTRVSISLGA